MVKPDRKQEKKESDSCTECKGRIRNGAPRMTCADCGLPAHKKCCGLNRWQRERGDSYRCRGCRNGGSEENQNEIEEIDRNSNENDEVPSMPSGRCDACGGFRKRNQGVCWTGCHKLVHPKCAFLTCSNWTCEDCKNQLTEKDRQEATDVDEEEQADVQQVCSLKRGNICIAQWNCDSLTTKVDELQSWLCYDSGN